jgi:hypothetical protein
MPRSVIGTPDPGGVPLFCLKALHRLGAPVTMTELGKQLHCDRSFVTMIAGR